MDYFIEKITQKDFKNVLYVLGNGRKVNPKDIFVVKKYFSNKWIGYGAYNPISKRHKCMIGYCFIKYPRKRPETMTVVHEKFRNQGIATHLRNFALKDRKFIGHIVYSAVKIDNPSSFKSILKSGFQVFDVTKDGYIQLIKILKYQ
jgi:GNAT superfamily N-acetyltransferase